MLSSGRKKKKSKRKTIFFSLFSNTAFLLFLVRFPAKVRNGSSSTCRGFWVESKLSTVSRRCSRRLLVALSGAPESPAADHRSVQISRTQREAVRLMPSLRRVPSKTPFFFLFFFYCVFNFVFFFCCFYSSMMPQHRKPKKKRVWSFPLFSRRVSLASSSSTVGVKTDTITDSTSKTMSVKT